MMKLNNHRKKVDHMKSNQIFYLIIFILFRSFTSTLHSTSETILDSLNNTNNKFNLVPALTNEQHNIKNPFLTFYYPKNDSLFAVKEVISKNPDNRIKDCSKDFIFDIREYKEKNPILYYLVKAACENNNFNDWGNESTFNLAPNSKDAILKRYEYSVNVRLELTNLWPTLDKLGFLPYELKGTALNEVCDPSFEYEKKFKIKDLVYTCITFNIDQQKVKCDIYPGFYYLKCLHNQLKKLTIYYNNLMVNQIKSMPKFYEQTKKHDIEKLTLKIKNLLTATDRLETLFNQAEILGLTQRPSFPLVLG